MERVKLKEARIAKGLREKRKLTQQIVAIELGCSVEIYSLWERGGSDPYPHYVSKLLEYYGAQDPVELDLVPRELLLSLEDILKMLEKYGRREVLAGLQALPAFAGLDLLALVEHPRIAPDEFLSQCAAGIKACWYLIQHDGLAHADTILSTCAVRLSDLATIPSDIQELAASLIAEAKIQQTILAVHRLDYRAREIYSQGAVRFGKLSGDGGIHAVAVSWLADMYTSSFNPHSQPKKAITLFKEGLAGLDKDALLNRADLSIGLGKAYALDGDEDNALEMVRQARIAMPEHPELDPHYQIIEFGLSELDQQEGRIYRELDRLFPDQGYAKLACDTFDRALGNQAVGGNRRLGQVLIQKADAAIALRDFREFARCLEQGLLIAFSINSLKRQSEGKKILSKAPEAWKKEDKYQNLVKMF